MFGEAARSGRFGFGKAVLLCFSAVFSALLLLALCPAVSGSLAADANCGKAYAGSSKAGNGNALGDGYYSIKIKYGSKASLKGNKLKVKGKPVKDFGGEKYKNRTWKFKLNKKTRYSTSDSWISKAKYKKLLKSYTTTKDPNASSVGIMIENGRVTAVLIGPWGAV